MKSSAIVNTSTMIELKCACTTISSLKFVQRRYITFVGFSCSARFVQRFEVQVYDVDKFSMYIKHNRSWICTRILQALDRGTLGSTQSFTIHCSFAAFVIVTRIA